MRDGQITLVRGSVMGIIGPLHVTMFTRVLLYTV